MSKKDNNKLEAAYIDIIEFCHVKDKIKELEKQSEKYRLKISNVMKDLGIDVIEFDNNTKDPKMFKALKYNKTKLEVIEKQKLLRYLKAKGLHKKVFTVEPDLKKLNIEFESGNISLDDIKEFITYKTSEIIKIDKVNKIK